MSQSNPTLWARRLGAGIYEILALFAIGFVATVPWVIFLPEHVVSSGNLYFQAYLLVCFQTYFTVCWVKSGQTLAMRAWRLRVVSADNSGLTWRRAILRFWVAVLSWLPLGLGHWWFFFQRERQTWHDLAADTHLILIPKR